MNVTADWCYNAVAASHRKSALPKTRGMRGHASTHVRAGHGVEHVRLGGVGCGRRGGHGEVVFVEIQALNQVAHLRTGGRVRGARARVGCVMGQGSGRLARSHRVQLTPVPGCAGEGRGAVREGGKGRPCLIAGRDRLEAPGIMNVYARAPADAPTSCHPLPPEAVRWQPGACADRRPSYSRHEHPWHAQHSRCGRSSSHVSAIAIHQPPPVAASPTYTYRLRLKAGHGGVAHGLQPAGQV